MYLYANEGERCTLLKDVKFTICGHHEHEEETHVQTSDYKVHVQYHAGVL